MGETKIIEGTGITAGEDFSIKDNKTHSAVGKTKVGII